MNSFNKSLAVSLALGGAVLFVILLVLLYLVPEPTLARIDNVTLKTLLLSLGLLSVCSIGIMLYWTFHTPSVRRLALAAWRTALIYSAVAGGFSVFGWPRLQSLSLDEESGLKADFMPFEASLDAWPNLAVCFCGIFAMTSIYMYVGVLEKRYGEEI